MLKHRHTARQDVCRAPGTPSRGCSIRATAATYPNGRELGSKIGDVRRGFATKSSTPCKTLVYLVVHPYLVHIITLKYARTLHKRRLRDARTNAPPHAHTHHPSRRALSRVQTCVQQHMKPAQKAGDCTAHRRGIAPRGSRGRRIAGPAPCAAPPAKTAPVAPPAFAPPLVAPPLVEDREEEAPPSSLASGWLSSHGARTRAEPLCSARWRSAALDGEEGEKEGCSRRRVAQSPGPPHEAGAYRIRGACSRRTDVLVLVVAAPVPILVTRTQKPDLRRGQIM